MHTTEQAFVYSADYVDAFVGKTNYFLQDSSAYRSYFSTDPELNSYHMINSDIWFWRFYENKIEIRHDKEFEDLSEEEIQRKILAVKRGDPESGHYYTSLDTFDTQSLLIDVEIVEWTGSENKMVLVARGEIEFQKRKLGKESV